MGNKNNIEWFAKRKMNRAEEWEKLKVTLGITDETGDEGNVDTMTEEELAKINKKGADESLLNSTLEQSVDQGQHLQEESDSDAESSIMDPDTYSSSDPYDLGDDEDESLDKSSSSWESVY